MVFGSKQLLEDSLLLLVVHVRYRMLALEEERQSV